MKKLKLIITILIPIYSLCMEEPNINLINAAKKDDFKLAESALIKGADVNIQDKEGYTPLIYAVIYGYKDIAKLLLQAGAKVDAITLYENQTPLMMASKCGSSQIKKKISKDQCKEIIKLLLDYGAHLETKNIVGDTALALAVIRENLKIVEFLLSNGADVNTRNNYGRTPLFTAVFINNRDNNDMVELLLKHSANPNISDKNDEAVLDLAVSKKRDDIVNLLKKYGAKE